MSNPTRRPLPPPFKVGTQLRHDPQTRRGRGYTAAVENARDQREHPEDWVQISGPGLEVVVAETKPGRRGTGQQLRDSDGPMFYEDTGEPILDETEDGRSVFYVEANGRKHGRIIWAKDKKEWKVIK